MRVEVVLRQSDVGMTIDYQTKTTQQLSWHFTGGENQDGIKLGHGVNRAYFDKGSKMRRSCQSACLSSSLVAYALDPPLGPTRHAPPHPPSFGS